MMKLELDTLKRILLEKWDYKEQQLVSIGQKLLKMDPALQTAFINYINEEQYPITPSYFGLDPKSIAQNYPFKPPAVFLCLDWIRREPEKALNALVEEYKRPLPDSFDPVALRKFLEEENKVKP